MNTHVGVEVGMRLAICSLHGRSGQSLPCDRGVRMMMVTCHEGVTNSSGFRTEVIYSKKNESKSRKHSALCDYVM